MHHCTGDHRRDCGYLGIYLYYQMSDSKHAECLIGEVPAV